MSSVCFTGHRTVDITADLEKRLTETVERLIAEGAADFYAGGAYGFDILCENTVINLKGAYPHIRLHLVLPCSAEEQTAGWSEYLKKQYRNVLSKADSVEYVSEHCDREAMRKRNSRLVELADACVCYYNVADRRSGTGMTVRLSEKKEINVINLFE